MDFQAYYSNYSWDLATPFHRLNSLPIDRSALFPSKECLQAYVNRDISAFILALNNALGLSEDKSYTIDTCPVNIAPYQGQYVAVVTGEDQVSAFVIRKVGTPASKQGETDIPAIPGSYKAIDGIENGDDNIYLEYDSTLGALKFVFI